MDIVTLFLQYYKHIVTFFFSSQGEAITKFQSKGDTDKIPVPPLFDLATLPYNN